MISPSSAAASKNGRKRSSPGSKSCSVGWSLSPRSPSSGKRASRSSASSRFGSTLPKPTNRPPTARRCARSPRCRAPALRVPAEQHADEVEPLVQRDQLLDRVRLRPRAEVALDRVRVVPDAAAHPVARRQMDVHVDPAHVPRSIRGQIPLRIWYTDISMPLSDLSPFKRELLRDRAYAALRDAIVDGTLAPGERLRDQELCEWLGLSRTPVREALARLEQDGLVETAPQRYTRVAPLDRRAARDAFPVVAALHALAAELAVPRLGEHDLAAMRAANERFAHALRAGRRRRRARRRRRLPRRLRERVGERRDRARARAPDARRAPARAAALRLAGRPRLRAPSTRRSSGGGGRRTPSGPPSACGRTGSRSGP